MDNKKNQILLVVGIVTLLFAVGGATYAFFASQNNGSDIKDVNVTTATTDSLTFNVSDNITITANQETFKSGGSNRPGEAIATATLTANNATNEATGHYYLYLNINKNEFKHVTESGSAELVLSVSKENSDGTYSPVTIASLGSQVTVGTGANEVTGYDITETKGLIEIANTDINATSEKTTVVDKYKVTITLVNLNENQNDNAGKSFNAEIIIQKDEMKTLSNEIKKLYTTDGANGLYHFDGIGDYTNANYEVNDGSYRYSGADYELTELATSKGYDKIMLTSEEETLDASSNLINFYCNGTLDYIGYSCSASKAHYYTVADSATQYQTLSKALDVAKDSGYITGDHIKNFVCFGTDEANCSEKNLYRIIGVFDNQVKLIKYDYATKEELGDETVSENYKGAYSAKYYSGAKTSSAGSVDRYIWNDTNDVATTVKNIWSQSNLNKLHLNGYYLNNFSEKWQEMIALSNWKVGGNNWMDTGGTTVNNTYKNEIINPNTTYESNYQAKVGLMYASDYGYATSPIHWTVELWGSEIILADNWMFGGVPEWMISRISDSTYEVISLESSLNYVSVSNLKSVRPTFYLSSGTILNGGSGTMTDPYRIQ